MSNFHKIASFDFLINFVKALVTTVTAYLKIMPKNILSASLTLHEARLGVNTSATKRPR